ncbi:MAG: hypothetical protein ACRDU8_06160, partial [Egibacteraceae bacterium]
MESPATAMEDKVRETSDVLDVATRCVVAGLARTGLHATPTAFWSDGSGLWLALPGDSPTVGALRSTPGCAVAVLPEDVEGAVARGAVIQGSARVHGLHDPVGLAVHGVTVSAAMAALAARNVASFLDYVQDASRLPGRYLPRNVVAIRVAVERLRPVDPPAVAVGIAPALPAVVPADVRRRLSGRRDIVLA